MSGRTAHIALLSPGAKVGLTRAFVDSAASMGARLSAWESDPWSPAARLCEGSGPGGPIETDSAVGTLLVWSLRNGVNLVVPTRHDDLPMLARHRDQFERAGVAVAISATACIELCLDKRALGGWLNRHGFPTPEHTSAAEFEQSPLAGRFPLIAKPARGSGSRLVRTLDRAAEVAALSADWIIQAPASGIEITVNTYVNRTGRCVCEIPHERLLVSEGEVVRGRTIKEPAVMNLARQISETLDGARGPLNIQLFWDRENHRAAVTDINPRFGGGYPLAHQAGGRFATWLLDEYINNGSAARFDRWEDRLLMARYREASFFHES
ncbi:MAG TPA: ATP-grasp domain-containing protein [Opitutaceae bacterium]